MDHYTNNRDAWQKTRRNWRHQGQSVGLVPTMGALHPGHLALVRRCRHENERAVVWIFVNPKQFGPQEDFQRYPRSLDADLQLLEAAGVDAVVAPSADAVYPPTFQTTVQIEGPLTRVLEGAARPGHFAGVATVVLKLLLLVAPQRVYFGQKDAQQVRVVQQMVRDLWLPVEVIECPIEREPDGLAWSSRHRYLKPAERQAATVIFRALARAREAFTNGERQASALCATVCEVLAEEPRVTIDYVALNHPQSLVPLDKVDIDGALLSLAVLLGSTRLIDNILLPAPAV